MSTVASSQDLIEHGLAFCQHNKSLFMNFAGAFLALPRRWPDTKLSTYFQQLAFFRISMVIDAVAAIRRYE